MERGAGATAGGADDAVTRLRRRLSQVVDLNGAQAVLAWDQETYMPAGGVAARARQLATLGRIAHERLIADETGAAIDAAAAATAGEDPGSDAARLVAVARRDFDKATRVPADLVAQLAEATALGQQAWQQAREASDFAAFQPHLERVLDLTLQKAEALGYESTPYDALLDEYEPDMKADRVAEVFAELREHLVPLVRDIAAQPEPDDSFLHRQYDEQAQWDFGVAVIRDLGYDFDRGRQDRSAHPFSISFSVNDARITTRVQPTFLPSCLFGTLHEAGHAMYEQGIDPAFEGTPLAAGTSLGVHESQSRLWENLVGRSRAFWRCYYPRLQAAFADALGDVSEEGFYSAVNKVKPSLIRVEADEITYNLHVMVRFEIELALVSGELTVPQLPDAWGERYEEYLGLTPPSAAQGVLQDIHWSMGAIGYFPTYALGNLMSAQLYRAAERSLGDIDELVSRGEFASLREWLRDNVHRHGRKYTANELLVRVTGSDLDAAPWVEYARAKFGALYGLRD